VAGPIPRATYAAIQTSGSCVYCGKKATTVDHVRPLFRGGWEHEDNLVPACKSCNFSKGTKLLTEWVRAGRVAHGVAHSSKVAAEYERLMALAAA
jgi:5-methylcytosine-specific restriction endonuclease McrA